MKKLIPERMRCRIADIRGRGIYSNCADEYKCIFIHIPKAAGTSVAKTLFGCGSRHVRYIEYEKANPRKFSSFFKFSFVRNPWDRLYSAYSFLKQGGMGGQDKIWADAHLGSYSDFDSFVKGWVNSESVWSWIHFMPQHHFICDDAMNMKMNFVGRFERIDADIAIVQQKLGIPVRPLIRVNATSKGSCTSRVYTKETRKIVERVYARDIELFHYDFMQAVK